MCNSIKIPSLYQYHHLDKNYSSIGLFRLLCTTWGENIKVLYPGSYVHITPSIVFPEVMYLDSHKTAKKFFDDPQVYQFICAYKEYTVPPTIRFYLQDYYEPLTDLISAFDLVISQYAGFVGQAVKHSLKKGGLLVCNNSHGDASMASLDTAYRLIAVYTRRTDTIFSITSTNLDTYLIPKSGIAPTKASITKRMRGIAYTKSPSGYIFEKVE